MNIVLVQYNVYFVNTVYHQINASMVECVKTKQQMRRNRYAQRTKDRFGFTVYNLVNLAYTRSVK